MFPSILLHAGGAGGPHWQFPPLHPILVNFTAALIPVSFAFDVLGRVTRKESLRSAGWWTLLAAVIVTPFTAFAGWWWLRTMGEMDHSTMTIHKWLGTSLAVAVVPMVLWRGWLYRRGIPPAWPYLLALLLVVGALVYQGDLGGSMSFGAGADADDAPHPSMPMPMSTPASGPSDGAAPADHRHEHGQTLRPGWTDHLDVS